MVGKCPRVDLSERNESKALPHAPVLDEILSNFLVLNNYIEELSTSSNLQCNCLVVVLLCKLDQLNGDAFYLSMVEVLVWGFILKVESGDSVLETIALLYDKNM